MAGLVHIPHVLGDKFGLGQIVSVQQAKILMEQCVYSASMAKNGIII